MVMDRIHPWPDLNLEQAEALAVAEQAVRKHRTQASKALEVFIQGGGHHEAPSAVASCRRIKAAGQVADLLRAWRRQNAEEDRS
jgi:hypothetical protein